MRPNLLLVLVLSGCAASRSSTPSETVPAPPTSPPAATGSSTPSEPIPAPATAVPVAPAAPAASGPFGTHHRFKLGVVSPDGQWLIGCQAREDTNRTVPYLFLEPGPGQPIDDYINTDPTGRYIAVIRKFSLWLIDARTRTETELVRFQANVWNRPDILWPLPVADFSPDGRNLLFLREEEQKVVAIVRDLSSGRERRLDAGAGELRSAHLGLSGEWVTFGVLVEDTNKDGRLSWLPRRTSWLAASCLDSADDSRGLSRDDDPIFRMRRLEGGPLRELGRGSRPEGELAHPMGRFILRRGPQGELFVEDESGHRSEWVPASCKGVMQHSDAERQLVVVACTSAGREAPAPIELHGASIHQPLGLSMRPPRSDISRAWQYPPPRLITLDGAPPTDASLSDRQSGQPRTPSTFILDLETHAVHFVTENVVDTRGALALLAEELPRDGSRKRRTRLTLLNVATGVRTELPEPQGREVHRAGSLILYKGVLVDMETGKVLGEISEEGRPVLALDPTGRVLRGNPDPDAAVPTRMDAWGPVSWENLAR